MPFTLKANQRKNLRAVLVADCHRIVMDVFNNPRMTPEQAWRKEKDNCIAAAASERAEALSKLIKSNKKGDMNNV